MADQRLIDRSNSNRPERARGYRPGLLYARNVLKPPKIFINQYVEETINLLPGYNAR